MIRTNMGVNATMGPFSATNAAAGSTAAEEAAAVSTYVEAQPNMLPAGPAFMNGPAARGCPRCEGWMQPSEFRSTLALYIRCFQRIGDAPSRREWNKLWGALDRDRKLVTFMWPDIEAAMDAHQLWERFFLAAFAKELERGLGADLKYEAAEALVMHVVRTGRHGLARWLLDYGRSAVQEGIKPSLHSALVLSLERAHIEPEEIRPLSNPAE